jgi:hypothetical protein
MTTVLVSGNLTSPGTDGAVDITTIPGKSNFELVEFKRPGRLAEKIIHFSCLS